MAGISQPSVDPKRTVVVLNVPSNIGEEDLTIHFQKAKHGGGDVDEVVVNENVAFVTFDSAEDAKGVLRIPQQTIQDSEIHIQNYETWLTEKKKREDEAAENNGVKTIYVGGIKETTTKDSVCLFFENKRRTGGGELCEGNQGYKRISPTVARLTFLSSKVVKEILRRSNQKGLILDGNPLRVTTEFEPTHDRSILLVKNLNPSTTKETLKDCVETMKNADVFNVILGEDGKAIVILKSEIGDDSSEDETSSNSENLTKLDGSEISLEFAPFTKGIRVNNIPQKTTPDSIKFKFSNPNIGGGTVTDIMLDRNNGVANVYFEQNSVVSALVKKSHKISDVSLTVIPYYDEFEELQKAKEVKKSEFSGDYHVEPLVMDYIFNHQDSERIKFNFKSMKYDEAKSTLHFTKDFDDSKLATEFQNKLKEFLHLFSKEEVKIPKNILNKVKETIESKRDEFDADEVDFIFDKSNVSFVGKKQDIAEKKQLVEAMIDQFTEDANVETAEMAVEEKYKLKFLNFIGYFEQLKTDFPGFTIHGTDSLSGKLSLVGRAEKLKDIQLRILQDLMKISVIEVSLSDRQIGFLNWTDCQIVNDELLKDDAMLLLTDVKGKVGAKGLQAKIFCWKKDNKEKKLSDIVHLKTTEKCVKVDEETAKVLAKSGKLQELKNEKFEKQEVLIDQELNNPCNIWIVCENSKMTNAEQELTSLTDEKKISSQTFKPMDRMKVRFLDEHCLSEIKQEERSLEKEGVVVKKTDSDSLEVTGTPAGRKQMILFLEKQAGNIDCKAYPLNEPGMKKQMNSETTDAIISRVERDYRCVIERESQSEEADVKLEEAPVVADGMVAGASAAGGATTMALPYRLMSFVNDKEVKMVSGERISIVVGDLAQQKVDVIVNTTNDKVDLTANPCGKALLKVAGNGLSTECQKIGSLQAGEMASTGPAKLNCKSVFHVRSSHYENGKGVGTLRDIIKRCLDKMEKDKLTSIAIPAIGTGNLKFPRPEVAKIFFEEVTGYFTLHPNSGINDVRFVAYNKDKATVDAFLAAVQEIKTSILSSPAKPMPVPRRLKTPSVKDKPTHVPAGLSSVTAGEKPDGTLEFSFGSKNLAVEIVCADISKETTDLIMHVTNEEFSFQGGVGKALIRAGGDNIVQEAKALGKPALFSTQYTKAGKLAVNQIAHVIGTGQPSQTELKKCLDNFFNDVSKKNIAKISFSAIGAGAMGFTESQSAELIFDNLSWISESKDSNLSLVRIVIFDKPKFIKFKDAAKAYFASGGATGSKAEPVKSSFAPKTRFNVFGRSKKFLKPTGGKDGGVSIKIYSDDRGKLDKAWGELKKKMNENIQERLVNDDVIKKFTDGHVEKLRELERNLDVKIKVEASKGKITIKGHISDVSTVQEEIHKLLKEINEKEDNVPDTWDNSPDEGVFHKVKLSTGNKEYKDIETAFRKTAPNPIVCIERIQNRKIYELYNVKRKAMMKKFGNNFPGKELMLFHGTSAENISKINSGGLNRSYAGMHAIACGRGVYFARDASYSCNRTYSPPDSQGLRYMYYAKVLVGDYTTGDPSMIVAPPKNTLDPNETFDSVVDNPANPSMYILFQDYEYYTEYLITFR
ncbi:uncharacterized protein LOC114533885 isoform X2 [Dendronephthya gigantea]|uniref:uncharacterized protein LOC114533885 isoform X2 n=1 Tax=Dendronephthya gigantea TaxID=151771 RepID=UPI00106D332E|nr:uncharacterized protein LOC114533885 isoform X2 [Dendronephthya gigantea]